LLKFTLVSDNLSRFVSDDNDPLRMDLGSGLMDLEEWDDPVFSFIVNTQFLRTGKNMSLWINRHLLQLLGWVTSFVVRFTAP
jgi:hypothetical protein